MEIDLSANASPAASIDAIRSVYIDNSFSFVPIYLRFASTEFMIICPANSVGMFPVFAGVGVKKCIAYAQDFDDTDIPVTTIHFSNVEVAGWVTGTGEFFPPVPPIPVVSIFNTDSEELAAAATTVYNFAAQQVGTADAARTVYAGILQRANVGTADVASVTIGGVAATLIQKQSSGGNTCLAIYAAPLAAGTTATIIVNTTATFQNVHLFTYAAYNLTTPLAANNNQHSVSPNPSVTLTTINNGCAIALAMTNSGSAFTGIGNNINFAFGGFAAGEGWQATNGGNLAISMAGGASVANLIASSFK